MVNGGGVVLVVVVVCVQIISFSFCFHNDSNISISAHKFSDLFRYMHMSCNTNIIQRQIYLATKFTIPTNQPSLSLSLCTISEICIFLLFISDMDQTLYAHLEDKFVFRKPITEP